MRLWTVRTAQHLDRARWPLRAGVRYLDPYLLPAYRWMAGQLSARVGPPPRGVQLPLWAWLVRPDLREGAQLARGSAGVVLEVELPDQQVLVSDFGRFHAVLNRHYLERSPADDARFQRLLARAGVRSWPFTPALRRQVEQSWERIFRFGARDADPRSYGPPEEATRQAVFWQLRRDQVLSERRFTAR
jgi:hypothetical protein